MPGNAQVNQGSPLATAVERVLNADGHEVCWLSGSFFIARLAEAGHDHSCRDVALCEQCGSSISTNIAGQKAHLLTFKHMSALTALPSAIKQLTGCQHPIAKSALRFYLESLEEGSEDEDSSEEEVDEADSKRAPVRARKPKKTNKPRKDIDAVNLLLKLEYLKVTVTAARSRSSV